MKAKNIICYSLILASFASSITATAITLPANIMAETSESDENINLSNLVSSNLGNNLLKSIKAPNENYYSEDELKELYEKFYDNDYYRDGFNKYIKTGYFYNFDTVKINKPIEESTISYSDNDFLYKLDTSIDVINQIKPLQTQDGKISFKLQTLNSDDVEFNVCKGNEISSQLKSILQGYKEDILNEYNLTDKEKEYCVAVAICLIQNNISISDLANSIDSPDEKSDIIINAINFLLDNKYEEKFIKLDFSSDVEIKEENGHYNIYSGENIVHTNFQTVDVKMYDTVGLQGLSIIKDSNTSEDNNTEAFLSTRSFSNEDNFKSLINMIYVDMGIDFEESDDFKQHLPKVYNNNYQIITAGDDISTVSYTDGENEFYIVQDETKVFLYDYDLHPEKYVDLYQKKNLNLTVIDKINLTTIPKASVEIYYKVNTNEKDYVYLNTVYTDNNGAVHIDNVKSGEYYFLVKSDNYVEEAYTAVVSSTSDDVSYKKDFDFSIYMNEINPTIKIKTSNDFNFNWSSHNFKIINSDTNEIINCQTDINSEITNTNLTPGVYTVISIDNDKYKDYERMLIVSNQSNNYIIDFSSNVFDESYIDNTINAETEQITIVNKLDDSIDADDSYQISIDEYNNIANQNILIDSISVQDEINDNLNQTNSDKENNESGDNNQNITFYDEDNVIYDEFNMYY